MKTTIKQLEIAPKATWRLKEFMSELKEKYFYQSLSMVSALGSTQHLRYV
jgi:hypothetical protein